MSDGRLPDFIIGGAMRSGTTSLYRYLDAHPEVAVAPKELGFFTDRFAEGLDWYRRQFDQGSPVVGEATADYLARADVMERIHQTLPDVKLVASWRNPVDRAWSHYGLLSARGRDPRSFEMALDEEMARLDADGDDADGVIYLSHGLYDVHLARARQLFGADRLHVVVFEHLRDDPATEYGRLCRYLGISDEVAPPILGRVVNPYVEFRSVALRDRAKGLPRPLGRVVARLNTRRVEAPALPDHLRDRLSAFYAPRVATVEAELGITVPEWHR